MSASYQYTQDDFKNSPIVDPGDLQIKVIGLQLSSATIQYINMYSENGGFIVDIYFNQSLSANDKLELDNLIQDYTYQFYENYYATIYGKKSNATNGGTFIANNWITRELTDIEGNQNFCVLSNNRITIQPGLYNITITAVAYGVQNHQMRLYNTTDEVSVAVSNCGFSIDANDTVKIDQFLKVNSQTTYEVQHQCSQTCENIGFGRASGFGEPEVYVTISIVPQNPIVQ